VIDEPVFQAAPAYPGVDLDAVFLHIAPLRPARWTGENRKSCIDIIGCDLPREALLGGLKC
jgi:hypothetical protein